MLPSVLAKQLEKGICDYIETTFPMINEPFKGSLGKMLSKKGFVYREPYIAVRLPFRLAEEMPTCFEAIHPSYKPYVHQEKAFQRLVGDDGRSTLVATGTGSGKTECFLYPILEYCYQHREERGIKALIIYPMNALASDQAKRIANLIYESKELKGNVSVGMYVGGEDHTQARMMTEDGVITDHETMLNNPPDILMTNYKMLDYLLVRLKDAALWEDNKPDTLKYIAVDELHTFDGAQGTDLACLLRRLKRRLGIYDGYLCCIGTSATMGTEDNNSLIIDYASEIFGERFDKDSVITEDRLSPIEFFDGIEVTEFTIPSEKQVDKLKELRERDAQEAYLKEAVEAWFPNFEGDVLSDAGRVELANDLKKHSFNQAVIRLTGGSYYQATKIADELVNHYPQIKTYSSPDEMINSLFALISHARSEVYGSLRPFLNVEVQLWLRELRRLLAKVEPEEVIYEIASDLNSQQAKQYLPVINCRDCGATGWVSVLNERGNATMTNLDAFYNMFFRADDKIVMMFPHSHDERIKGMIPAKLCPSCLQLSLGEDGANICPKCDTDMIDVLIHNGPIKTSGSQTSKQYICPHCGSRRGLSLMGLRSATEISASISQMYASKFNDDKKLLAFSDNVQDAAHRAGFFNARTWKFGLRTAIQRYCNEEGKGKSLLEYQNGFISYWHEKMEDKDFVGYFIAPNMIWRQSYEDMIKSRELSGDPQSATLIRAIEDRLKYEIMLEYGFTSKIGRTLEKSNCSVLDFAIEDISDIAKRVMEKTTNELGVMTSSSQIVFERMVEGYLNIMRINGAFVDPIFDKYTETNAHDYMLSSNLTWWLPGSQPGRNTPRFVVEHIGKGKVIKNFDELDSNKYVSWIEACCDEPLMESSSYAAICKYIVDEAVKQGLIALVPSSTDYKVYGLKKERIYIHNEVVQMRCHKCGSIHAVSNNTATLWEGAPCHKAICGGTLEAINDSGNNYYGRLYSSGDLARINAKEHTGLLERPNRERLEMDFKRDRATRQVWDPNVLSCTPTLEMGIDIGDLSTVALCSMPPSQSQYLQRTGRAGRKDGNALTLAVANARPHDLYFYSDPLDMIDGNVAPPKVFLKASAVLERQFIAFCLDSWVKEGIHEKAIPSKVGIVLKTISAHSDENFPFNFLAYVQSKKNFLYTSFIQLFDAYLDDNTREELRAFAWGKDGNESKMHINIVDSFEALKKQEESILASIKTINDLIEDLKAKPEDKSYEEEISELKKERNGLINVHREMRKKNIYNFLSDEGILPNYAFPEAGILLRAVLYRKKDEAGSSGNKTKYESMVYEYNRSASSAISEFAPNNNFYVDGRKLSIDQVDLTTAETERWRLCTNCSHAEKEGIHPHTSTCPQCGSPTWADSGQVRSMLKVQMVYSNMDYKKSLIGDDSEDRSNTFYCKQLLVDVDEEHDIHSAYRMDNNDFPFGYEFVRKASLREINFGESDLTGEKMTVSGVEEVRKGFKICKYCGKIQREGNKKSSHSFSCKTKKNPTLLEDNSYEDCLFLYREFDTEVLRLLVPATTEDSSLVKLESFVAAFMLGMKEYFGNVDHLRATVSEVPVANADYRKQYLVIYDSIPGGTGYLKQLMNEKNALVEIFEKALNVLENCSCKDDPEKDGCYHCLYAYRQSRKIGNVSRTSAIKMLKSILSGRANVEKIRRINDIPVNPLFDSELEQKFVEAVSKKVGSSNVTNIIRNEKHSYRVNVNDIIWEIEPQAMLDASKGVAVACKPDFIFWPIDSPKHKPLAVFTDGFTYHKDIVADDTVKREAIRRSGEFRVWSLSYKDVQSVFEPQGDYATDVFDVAKMPSGSTVYKGIVQSNHAEALKPDKTSTFDLLFEYLRNSDAEELFSGQATAYANSILNPKLFKKENDYGAWNEEVSSINEQVHFTDKQFSYGNTMFGTWKPRTTSSHVEFHAGITIDDLKNNGITSVCSILYDANDNRTDRYEEEWNGFWHFNNLMQFNGEFSFVSETGLSNMDYLSLPFLKATDETNISTEERNEGWNAIAEMLIDQEAIDFVNYAIKNDIPIPAEDDIGYELEGEGREVIATVEIAWPDRKIVFMTSEQLAYKEIVEGEGWSIFSSIDMEKAVDMFGGENK